MFAIPLPQQGLQPQKERCPQALGQLLYGGQGKFCILTLADLRVLLPLTPSRTNASRWGWT